MYYLLSCMITYLLYRSTSRCDINITAVSRFWMGWLFYSSFKQSYSINDIVTEVYRNTIADVDTVSGFQQSTIDATLYDERGNYHLNDSDNTANTDLVTSPSRISHNVYHWTHAICTRMLTVDAIAAVVVEFCTHLVTCCSWHVKQRNAAEKQAILW